MPHPLHQDSGDSHDGDDSSHQRPGIFANGLAHLGFGLDQAALAMVAAIASTRRHRRASSAQHSTVPAVPGQAGPERPIPRSVIWNPSADAAPGQPGVAALRRL